MVDWLQGEQNVVLFIPTVSGPGNDQKMEKWQNGMKLVVPRCFSFLIWRRWSQQSLEEGVWEGTQGKDN